MVGRVVMVVMVVRVVMVVMVVRVVMVVMVGRVVMVVMVGRVVMVVMVGRVVMVVNKIKFYKIIIVLGAINYEGSKKKIFFFPKASTGSVSLMIAPKVSQDCLNDQADTADHSL